MKSAGEFSWHLKENKWIMQQKKLLRSSDIGVWKLLNLTEKFYKINEVKGMSLLGKRAMPVD